MREVVIDVAGVVFVVDGVALMDDGAGALVVVVLG